MNQAIILDKTFQERLQEYTVILSNCEVSNLKRTWSFYIELSVDPSGWQAIWKIPRTTCEQLNIPYPTVVLVYVENVEYSEHTAIVRILAVQDDDIHLPKEYCVPLVQLWPTKEQDKSVGMNLTSTANAVDALRFFYMNLYMPWDDDDNDGVVWFNNHLETRLRLFYDMKNGVIPRITAERLRSLVTEVRRLETRHQEMIVDLDDYSDVDSNDFNIKDDEKLQKFMEVQVGIKEIQNEFEFLENPLSRVVYIKKQEEAAQLKKNQAFKHWIVLDESCIDDSIDFFQRLRNDVPKEILKTASNLDSVLEVMNANDSIFLSKKRHTFRYVNGLELGGTLKGVYDKNETIITSNCDNVMLHFRGDVTLQNLTIDAAMAQCCILVRSGKLTIINCNIISERKSSTHQGIIVLSNSELELVDCKISGFATGIVVNSRARVSMKNCEIRDVGVGLKVFDDCKVEVSQTTFEGCQKYGVYVETSKPFEGDSKRVGDFNLLQP